MPGKAVFCVTDTTGYLILSRDSKEDRVHTILKDYPSKVNTTAKDTCTHEGNIGENIKAGGSKCEGSRSETSEGPGCVVLINGKKHILPITKKYILKEYSDVFNRAGTLLGKEYYITLKKNYVPVQHTPKISPSQDQGSM